MGRESYWKKHPFPMVKCVFHSNQLWKITRFLQRCERNITQDWCVSCLNTNSRHPLIRLYWDHHSFYQRMKRKVEKRFLLYDQNSFNNCENKFDILDEKELVGYTLCMAKKTSLSSYSSWVIYGCILRTDTCTYMC